MPDVERAEIIGDAPREPASGGGFRAGVLRPGPRAVPWLAGALVIALAGAAVLGALLYAQVRQTDAERAGVAAARAWVAAIDRHDLAAVQRLTDPGAPVLVVGANGVSERAFRGQRLVAADRLTFESELALRILGEPVVVREDQVAMTTRLTCDGDDYTHLTVLNLRRSGEAVTVAGAVMTWTPASRASGT